MGIKYSSVAGLRLDGLGEARSGTGGVGQITTSGGGQLTGGHQVKKESSCMAWDRPSEAWPWT
jgi:hypothetical protein